MHAVDGNDTAMITGSEDGETGVKYQFLGLLNSKYKNCLWV